MWGEENSPHKLFQRRTMNDVKNIIDFGGNIADPFFFAGEDKYV
jgi:hypothetical protein